LPPFVPKGVCPMSTEKYGVGDTVILNEGMPRNARRETEFRIVAVLPEIDGQAQYQVRSKAEGFDRRIAAGEIDAERSSSSRIRAAAAAVKTDREPWFKASAIRTTKKH
jgi:hypothetical protein